MVCQVVGGKTKSPPAPLFQRGELTGGLSKFVLFINVGKSLFGKEGFREISS